MQPTFETELDRRNEREVAEELGRAWHCEAIKMPSFYHCDYSLVRGNVVIANVEIKCRNNSIAKYPTYILTANKWAHNVMISEITNVAGLLVVRFDEGIFYRRFTRDPNMKVIMSGAYDRDPTMSKEPVIEIPIRSFMNVPFE